MENFDPDNPSQGLIHNCMKHARRHLNPIIDWTTDEVWEFIHKYNVPYCCLYDQGFHRLGCIGCPMGTVEHRKMEFERWPKYKQAYIHAFDRMIAERNRGGMSTQSNSERSSSENGQMTTLENSTTKIKHPEIIEQLKQMDTEERFNYWVDGKAVPTKIDRHVLDRDRAGTDVANKQTNKQTVSLSEIRSHTEWTEKMPSTNGTSGKGWGYEFDEGEKLFDFWHTAPSGMFKSDENAIPENKFDQNSTGEEVMGWWIK